MRRVVVVVLSFIVILGALTALVWWYYRSHTSVGNTTQAPSFVPPQWYATDKDGDTITDDKEKELGTNPNEGDTDGDTVSDQLEINVYKTDPLKSDTDGDGYPDGLEIIQGHDPLKKASVNQ